MRGALFWNFQRIAATSPPFEALSPPFEARLAMVTRDRWMELHGSTGQQIRRTASPSPQQARPCGLETVACRCREADDRFRSRLRAAYLGYIPPFECARRGWSKRNELLSDKTLSPRELFTIEPVLREASHPNQTTSYGGRCLGSSATLNGKRPIRRTASGPGPLEPRGGRSL